MNKNNSRLFLYYWKGISEGGAKLSGTMEAKNSTYVTIQLKHEKIKPYKITKKIFPISKKISHEKITIFFRQLSILLQSGIALSEALQTLQTEERNYSLKKLILNIKNEIDSGKNFCQSLLKNLFYFDSLTIHLIDLGEQTGNLDKTLQLIAKQKERFFVLKKQILQALLYPFIVFVLSIIITLAMMIFVIPKFQEFFSSLNHQLPVFTQIVMDLSSLLRKNFKIIIFFTLFLSVIFYKLAKSKKHKQKLYFLLHRIPFLNTFIKKISLSRFLHSITISHSAGLPIADGIRLSQTFSSIPIFQESIQQLYLNLSKGMSLYGSMKLDSFFPVALVQMIKIGEESGKMDFVLERTCLLYEEEVNSLINNIKLLLEPLIMITLGVLIGSLVIAMYLPIFKLGTLI